MKVLTAAQEAQVRQASAERFPHPVPPGLPARRSNLSNPNVSNIDLWSFYSVPEVRAICDRVAGGVGRVNFMPCVNLEGSTGDNCPPVIGADGEIAEGVSPRLAADCAEIWAQVRSPSGPQSDIFTSIATALMVSGDAWQFGYPGTPEMRWNPEGLPMWVGVSRQSITERDGQYVVAVGIDGEVRVPSSPETDGHGTAIRIWNQDPRWPALANSWMTSCVRSLQILAAIYEAVAAVALSRLNAGLIIAPSDQDQPPIPSASEVNGGQFPLGTDLQQRLYDEIGDHVEASAQEMDGWSRVVPAVVGVDSSIADKISWVELARNMDPELRETIDNLRHRIYMASPLPPEVAEGMSEVSGLGGGNVAAQIDQSEYQRAILPVCERIAWANTQHVLRAGLLERNYTQLEVDRVQIGFSAKNLLMPPDRSESAIQVYNAGELTGTELREATGLGEFAGPDDEQTRADRAMELLKASSDYSFLLPEVGLEIPAEGGSKVAIVGVPSLLYSQTMTINEGRLAVGLATVPGGDRLLTVEEIAALNAAQAGQAAPTPEAPPSVEAPSEVIDVDEPAEIEAPADDDQADDEADDEAAVRQASADDRDYETGRRQLAIATLYEERLGGLVDGIVARMVERASAKVTSLSRSKSWADVREVVKASVPEMVGVHPKVRSLLRAEGVDDGDLFEPALAAFATQFETATRRAQRAAVREVGGDWDTVEADADEASASAWGLLGLLLIGEARRRFDGVLPDPETGEGALRPFGIPSSIISRVSAVAGGQADVTAGAVNGRTGTVAVRTIATGPIAETAAREASRVILGYTWDYRPELERNSYEPHWDLHQVFGLSDNDFDGYYPLDHAGCLCDLSPVYGAI